jgi:hypothetical protein
MVTTNLGGAGDPPVPAADPGTPEEFFADCPAGMQIYSAVYALLTALGPVGLRVSRSHVGFRRGRSFAYLWRPRRWLRAPAPEVVLSFALDHALAAPRIKEVVHPSRTIWIHHVELPDAAAIDEDVAGWLAEAYRQAAVLGNRRRARRVERHEGGAAPAERVSRMDAAFPHSGGRGAPSAVPDTPAAGLPALAAGVLPADLRSQAATRS